MDDTRPPERPSEPARDSEGESVAESASGVRCPYCKGGLVEGALAGVCVACGTVHHIACFAEHGGCSTHACGSTHARPGKVGEVRSPPMTFAGLHCAACKLALASDAMVARCDGCHTVLHASCYEKIGNCMLGAGGACRGSLELMPHEEAAARQQLRGAYALMIASALTTIPFAVLSLVAYQDDEQDLATVFVVAAVISLALFLVGVVMHGNASRARQSRSRPPRAPGPSKDQ